MDNASHPLGVALYPQLPPDLWAILHNNPDLVVCQTANAPAVLSLYRRHWVYDEWMFLSQKTAKLRALYRLDPVDVGAYASVNTWVMAFDADGGRLQMVNEAQYTVSYELPLSKVLIGDTPVEQP